MTVRKDYSPYGPLHRELFGVLRRVGSRPHRYVEFPDAAQDADGKASGLVILEDDAAACFLRSRRG
jgi:hypothetical protein